MLVYVLESEGITVAEITPCGLCGGDAVAWDIRGLSAAQAINLGATVAYPVTGGPGRPLPRNHGCDPGPGFGGSPGKTGVGAEFRPPGGRHWGLFFACFESLLRFRRADAVEEREHGRQTSGWGL